MRKRLHFSLLISIIGSILLSGLLLATFFYDSFISTQEEHLAQLAQVYIKSGASGNMDIDGTIKLEVLTSPQPGLDKLYIDYPYGDFTLRVSGPRQNLAHILLPSLILSTGLIMILVLFLNILSSRLMDELDRNLTIVNSSIGNILNSSTIDLDLMDPEFRSFAANINLYKEQADYYIEELKKNEKFRREFTANVSHELKTPLTSINGYAEMLEYNMVKPEDLAGIGQIIHGEGKRLLELIDSIIELSNLENPSLKLEFNSVNIFEIIESSIGKLQTRLDDKNISLSLTGRDYFIRGNSRMLKDLAYNLLDNAIKYNIPGGSIDISLREDKNKIVLSIEDSGIGISQEDLSRIFERFYIVDKSRNRNLNSTGLGLSIVKHIVEAHRAKISISSEVSQGTKIEISFKI